MKLNRRQSSLCGFYCAWAKTWIDLAKKSCERILKGLRADCDGCEHKKHGCEDMNGFIREREASGEKN
jgi:hypothetical protein